MDSPGMFSQESFELIQEANRNSEESFVPESSDDGSDHDLEDIINESQTISTDGTSSEHEIVNESSESSDDGSDQATREIVSESQTISTRQTSLSTVSVNRIHSPEILPNDDAILSESSNNETSHVRSSSLIQETISESSESSSSRFDGNAIDDIDAEIIFGTPQESDSSEDEDEDESIIEMFDPTIIAESEDNESNANDDSRTICPIQPEPFNISDEAKSILRQIEKFILGVVKDIFDGRKVQISVQNRSLWSNCIFEDEKFSLRPMSTAKCRTVRSTFSLSVIFFVLSEIYELVQTNRKCTMRELYYKDVTITQSQENVSEALKVICCLLDKAPWQLGVMSSSKGIISGPLRIELPDNIIVDCGIHKTGMTLPHFTSDIVGLTTTAEHVLVVEKDTVFKKLVQCDILERWNQKCILITGRGYPDINTRLILKKLFEMLSLPIDIITDADPYGIEIMLTYRHGSLSLSNLSESLVVPSIRWLGIFPSDIKKFGIKSIPLNAEDKRKLQNLLDRPYINDHVHRELLIMKQINLKAEIEGIGDSSCAYLIDVYLRNKIDNKEAI